MPKEKIVLIGAGSAMFTRGMVRDLISRGWEADLALVDVDSEALAVAERLTRKMLDARRAPVRLTAATDRRNVLADATAVICTIGVGGRRAWEQDVFIPRRYGIYQPVGDSVMPGGTSRALRMIPAMVDIAEDVLDLAPKAMFFNYGNPMAPICRAVHKATGAGVVGLCHGVFGVAEYLAKTLDVKREELGYTAIGMNHLTWFTEIYINGRDAFGRLSEIADDASNINNPFSWGLLKLFGAFPAVLDRHITEFFPQMFSGEKAYYGKTLGVDVYSLEQTIAKGDSVFEQMRADALGDKPLDDEYFRRIEGEHEQVLDIIRSIRNDDGRVYSANFPNTGQVPNLPAEAVVESPASASCGRLRPIMQRPLPPALAGTLASRFMWVETVVEAALEGSRSKFVQALVLDGAVDSIETAVNLADDLLAAQAEYLPQFDNGRTGPGAT